MAKGIRRWSSRSGWGENIRPASWLLPVANWDWWACRKPRSRPSNRLLLTTVCCPRWWASLVEAYHPLRIYLFGSATRIRSARTAGLRNRLSSLVGRGAREAGAGGLHAPPRAGHWRTAATRSRSGAGKLAGPGATKAVIGQPTRVKRLPPHMIARDAHVADTARRIRRC
jgi:hypothetical protein